MSFSLSFYQKLLGGLLLPLAFMACGNAPSNKIPIDKVLNPHEMKALYDSISSDTSVIEGYKPERPIRFSHKLHSGELGLDCMHCHKTGEKRKTIELNTCQSCHKYNAQAIQGLKQNAQKDSIYRYIEQEKAAQ